MKSLRRYHIQNSTYFITCVTHRRREILQKNIELFNNCWSIIQPFAYVVMPDHFHVMIEINDMTVSKIMHDFKIRHSRRFREEFGFGRVWQNRFWDHIIRDQADMYRHIDYIHYNPVKHGLAESPFDWECSSIHEFGREGYYEDDWGQKEPDGIYGDFGE